MQENYKIYTCSLQPKIHINQSVILQIKVNYLMQTNNCLNLVNTNNGGICKTGAINLKQSYIAEIAVFRIHLIQLNK